MSDALLGALCAAGGAALAKALDLWANRSKARADALKAEADALTEAYSLIQRLQGDNDTLRDRLEDRREEK